ncbi:Cytochrome P450 monooxygenase trt6 [Lasiodiplodia theobromae]|uniref:Cytochrome P450 monooxygenase trt6 n=1 Tax=Lasiodiplodia theobromae TaxID=45133 RepID=A0A5N5D8I8_9PEZI|nr:Cytochrome P450 monooxygenase trt6 [Lasiodiplodia theobromae]
MANNTLNAPSSGSSGGSLPFGDPTTVLFSALAGLFLIIFHQWSRTPKIPTINAYPGDWMLKKAHKDFEQNARALIREGTEKFKGPFRIITALSSTILVPTEWAEWVKNCNDLDHLEWTYHEFFAGYPGWEGITAAVCDPNKLLIEITKSKLNQNSRKNPWSKLSPTKLILLIECTLFREQITKTLHKVWTDKPEWHSIDWHTDSLTFVSQMSAAVFVGPELCADPEWQDITITYAVNMFLATRALRRYPRFTRTLANWFLPESTKCREQVRRGRRMIQDVMEKRAKERREALSQGREPEKHEDTLAWLEERASKGKSYDPVAIQLGFAMAGLHTTTQLLKQAVLDICGQPELVAPLREEVEKAVAESGWTTAGLYKMQLLDSAIKETLRLKPGLLANLERRSLKDITLPDGTKIPRGTNVSVDSSRMWDPTVYGDDAAKFDGFRFLRLRNEGAPATSMVSSSPEQFTFGMGKSICPGRFFVHNEVKVALATILLEYDVKLTDGYTPKFVEFGFEIVVDPAPKVEVRRR